MLNLIPLFLLALSPGDKQPDILETMQVRVATVDIMATLKDGTPVTDLTLDDFEVFENKKKVDVSIFETLDFVNPVPITAASSASSQAAGGGQQEVTIPAQTLIMLLELGNADLNQRHKVLDDIDRFLADLKGRENLMIYLFSMEKGTITDRFTNDPASAHQAFLAFKEEALNNPGQNLSYVRNTRLDAFEVEARECYKTARIVASGSREGTIADGLQIGGLTIEQIEGFQHCLRAAYDEYSQFQALRTRQILSSLERLIAGFSKLEGMKSLYLISPGFSMRPGTAATEMSRDYQREVVRRFQRPGGDDGDKRRPRVINFNAPNLTPYYRRVAHAALANRTVLHTFSLPNKGNRNEAQYDGQGLSGKAEQFHQQFQLGLDKGMSNLASTTGGIHRFGQNLPNDLNKTINETGFYYVLGYNVKPGKPKKFRKITVKCRRKDVVLRHRSGYYPDPKRIKHR